MTTIITVELETEDVETAAWFCNAVWCIMPPEGGIIWIEGENSPEIQNTAQLLWRGAADWPHRMNFKFADAPA